MRQLDRWHEEQKIKDQKFKEMAQDFRTYEKKQWTKAFMDGTDEAWKRYRANMKRRINKIYKETGYRISLDRI